MNAPADEVVELSCGPVRDHAAAAPRRGQGALVLGHRSTGDPEEVVADPVGPSLFHPVADLASGEAGLERVGRPVQAVMRRGPPLQSSIGALLHGGQEYRSGSELSPGTATR